MENNADFSELIIDDAFVDNEDGLISDNYDEDKGEGIIEEQLENDMVTL